ncbi:MAG: hypothetical protein BWY73_01082 [candidate division TA06 bacterium ADurb.Bin417]|uniref:Uncharacterized protein n=1 Tax=candidate division TA06 bacterium ADurb.Bin417 TaxID=1852828 RepID=A0A1V5MF91_UNCT6|nr:MAG: hypothetical protein BWY73_01082 [candidate division TA06 bacterium ADurb.Bin417]
MKKKSLDPAVVLGNRFREFRVQFWEYATLSLLKAFAAICEKGGFGRIDSFNGAGRIRSGAWYRFQWQKGRPLKIETTEAGAADEAGGLLLKGELDFFTINRIRNFPLFHLRGLYRKEISAQWGYHD